MAISAAQNTHRSRKLIARTLDLLKTTPHQTPSFATLSDIERNAVTIPCLQEKNAAKFPAKIEPQLGHEILYGQPIARTS